MKQDAGFLTTVFGVAVGCAQVVAGEVRHRVALPEEVLLELHDRIEEIVRIPNTAVELSLKTRNGSGGPPVGRDDGVHPERPCAAGGQTFPRMPIGHKRRTTS